MSTIRKLGPIKPRFTCRRCLHTSNALRNHYETLALEQGASKAQIKSQFYKLSKEHHPDFHPTNREQATKKFHNITAAYEILKDDRKRREYDKEVLNLRSANSRRPTRRYTGSRWKPPKATGSHIHDTYAPREEGASYRQATGQSGTTAPGVGAKYKDHFERHQIAEERMAERRRARGQVFNRPDDNIEEKFSSRLGQAALTFITIWGAVAVGVGIFR